MDKVRASLPNVIAWAPLTPAFPELVARCRGLLPGAPPPCIAWDLRALDQAVPCAGDAVAGLRQALTLSPGLWPVVIVSGTHGPLARFLFPSFL